MSDPLLSRITSVRRALVPPLLLLSTTSVAVPLRAQGSASVGLVFSQSWEARSVSPREPLAGSLTGAGLQRTRPLGTWAGLQWSYLVTADALLARVGASASRLATIPDDLASLYRQRTRIGVGISPLGVQLSRSVGTHTRLQVAFAGGGMLFSRVMPYGDDGTRANFVATPRVFVERDVRGRAIAIGYLLQHISNGGFGRANPGLNAQSLAVRLSPHASTP